ncbi:MULTISPECIES: flagellar motor protein MotB [unclassified Sphingomonas]|uniref:flagellar motor protein MotB n=1 Tax=unclassified Sphingomonas TaxID=196159 RepID=UPI0006F2A987|nr:MULTISPECIES: flagellar motor protein MotB [unclassified Sphingomonas]KQX26105.1 flagellar motor protein MotB [Sphingomonas sp. Root1294]KQY69172.1 flagellar motor protein MotB [Sphingomonas sp. Root50]KRB89427.1 flagellar motor protein MotB [Sphingomonas sp. Root720]
MAQSPTKRGKNEPEPRPIIIKKIIEEGHGGHHGGAWKVAYADFVTAMMAFFLLMWILGATDEKQRKGIADYFTPTMVQFREKSAGANGIFGGESIVDKDNYPHRAAQTGSKSITIPKDASGGAKDGGEAAKSRDRAAFQKLKMMLQAKMAADPKLAEMMRNVRMVETREGLRIDLVDQADFAMFTSGTDQLSSEARALMKQVAEVTNFADNSVIVRGHTDAMPYSKGRSVNNWTLSAARAESTRKALSDFGVSNGRFARIEGVADREPYVAGDPYDPRNRRMSITLAWSAADGGDDRSAPPASHGSVDLMAGAGSHDPTAMPAEALAQLEAKKARK